MKFRIRWMFYESSKQLFIGIGFVIGKEMVGLTISNLFIGFIRGE